VSGPGPGPGETLDPILRGLVRVLQAKRGYRFSLDAVLLADFAAKGPRARAAVELGAGSGVVALLLAAQGTAEHVTAVEIQAALADRARRSARLNELSERVSIVEGDLKDAHLLPRQAFDLVVSNPPFRPPEKGKASPEHERALARHEIAATLRDVVGAAKRLVRSNGRVCFVYPAGRLAEVCAELLSAGLPPRRLRLVHPSLSEPAELCLFEARPGKRGELAVLPPLVVYEAPEKYSEEMRQILRS
jgi:tRNA1Val (adenine37-N6)-methyltransferase